MAALSARSALNPQCDNLFWYSPSGEDVLHLIDYSIAGSTGHVSNFRESLETVSLGVHTSLHRSSSTLFLEETL